MTDIWLGVIAVAVTAMALVQAIAAVYVARLAKQATETTRDLRRDLTPLIAKANKISDDAAKVTALALTQVERVDQVMSAAAQRIDDTLNVVQDAIVTPVRQGAAVIAGVRAAMAVFRARQDKGRYSRDDEDALFIG